MGHGGAEGWIILKPTLRANYEDVDWIHLAQDRNQWMGLINIAINLLVSSQVGKLTEHLGDYQL